MMALSGVRSSWLMLTGACAPALGRQTAFQADVGL
jgi:hypothetical protein